MANPRNRGKNTDQEGTDDMNIDAVGAEDTEAVDTEQASEPVNEKAASTPAPKEPKEVIDHEGNLFAAISKFAEDGDAPSLQESYRAVPTAARGKTQGIALKRAMTEAGVGMEVLGKVLEAWNNLPTATRTTRTPKAPVDPAVAGGIKLIGLMHAYRLATEALGEEADSLARQWFKDGVPSEHEAASEKVTSRALAVIEKAAKSSGGSGVRVAMTETVADLINRGAIAAGTELTGAGGATATVEADGSIVTNGEKFASPSAAARVHRPAKNGSGKNTSTNGWGFWKVGDNFLGSLRIK